MKVRITVAPSEREIDGIKLENMVVGVVREVSPTVGSWLIAKGYAVLEMRREEPDINERRGRFGINEFGAIVEDRRRKRSF